MTSPILLWGATGFTGKLVAEHLAQAGLSRGQLILGGRNAQRLEALAAELGLDVELRIADAHDPSSLGDLLDGVGVVATTVGPYRRYGWSLVQACAERGVDYVDLCGETPFIRQSVDELSEVATQSGARIVHACGFDSIPSDLGTLMLAQEFHSQGKTLGWAQASVRRLRGGLSGGTYASIMGLVEDAAKDRSLRRVLGHPYSLNPPDQREGADGTDRSDARFDHDHDRWTAPFLMAGINTRVVRRSVALLGYASDQFRYDEAMICRNKRQAKQMAFGLKAFTLFAALAPTRMVLRRFLKQPGQGPGQSERENGCFEIHILGRVDASSPPLGRVIVAAQGDPGYSQTAIMIAESARLLAEGLVSAKGGVHTPASALGMDGVERLKQHGFQFEFQADQSVG
jgi:short subunit dehydrogenase-like uncharacterized protein